MHLPKLCLAALSIDRASWFVQGERHRIGDWEIHAIGDKEDGSDTPFAKMRVVEDGGDEFAVLAVNVEGKFTDGNSNSETWDGRYLPTIEAFAGVERGEACDTGDLLTLLTDFGAAYVDAEGKKKWRNIGQTQDGDYGSALVEMPLHDSSVWTPINADNFKVGTFEACVRISRKHDTDYVVFFDTFFSLKIDAKGLFQTFEQEILVEEFGNVQNYDKEETRKIGVDAYLCGPSTSANPGRSYAIGQSFHVCVGPKQAELEKGFAVVGFHDVTCAGTDVVTDGDFADQLTSVARNPVDFIDGKENPEAVATDAGVAYFETVVTPEFYAGSEAGSFTCEGRVDLEQKSPEEGVGVEIPTRRLTASFSRHSDDLSRRHLQERSKAETETDTDTGSSFGITVGLLRDGESADAPFGDLAGPAADTGGVPGTAMATAAGAAVLAALL